MARILAVFTCLPLLYCSGFSSYVALSLFIKKRAIPEKSIPPIPAEQQQAIKEIIPKTNEIVTLGNFFVPFGMS